MLTSVEVRTESGDLLLLPLDDVIEGYVIQEITGLDPVKANIVSSSFARMDGEQYQASRREKRNIVITLGLEPDYSTSTVRQLRKRLYDFFMPKAGVNLTFNMDDDAAVNIEGKIESFDAPLFSKDPTATISILCMDPDFYEENSIVVSGNSVADLTNKLITYDGSVETGFLFRLLVNRSITSFSVINLPPDGVQRRMDFSAALNAGDVLEFSSVSGAKRVSLIRSGSTTSLLYSLSPYSDWINLFPGDNQFRVSISGVAIPYTVTYTNKHGGL
jgi:hypothetical protein